MKRLNRKQSIRKFNRVYIKPMISWIMVCAMLFTLDPIANTNRGDGTSVMVHAAGNENAEPPASYEFRHNDNNEITLSVKEFYDYSRRYQEYPGYHQNDKITIITSNGNTSYFERGFVGLGTAGKPFAGSIVIESYFNVTLNLDAPLFSYVKDTVNLNDGHNLNISRLYGFKIPSGESKKDTTPLIAENVVAGEGTKATWNISVVKPSSTDDEQSTGKLEDFGGMIGTMDSSSSLTLNIIMDQQSGDTDPINMKSESNLGLACGTMKSDSTLNFTIGASSSGTLRNVENITTTKGNVGGLVGEMKSGSTFNYTGNNIQPANKSISTSANGYAGGIVGKIDMATVNLSQNPYVINQYIAGKTGTGSVYGYFKPKDDETTVDLSKYTIGGQVNGDGFVGGVYGHLETSHDFTIDTAVTISSEHASGAASAYGGLIGKYSNSDLTKTLLIGEITANPKLTSDAKATYYGGAIGVAAEANANYIKFDGFILDKATGAGNLTFGGLVSCAKNSFIDAKDITIKVNGTYSGGGLVGDLGNGVLRMTGTTDLSNAKSVSPTSDAYKYGQIVGIRDNAIIFAEYETSPSWKLKRSDAVSVDDIGAWGEVIRFDSKDTDEIYDDDNETYYNVTYEQFDNTTVLMVNESLHTIKIEDSVNSIGSVADFAKTALNIQISSGDIITLNSFLGNIITLTSDIDLSGTGFTGFTRDNDKDNNFTEPHCVFSKYFYADGHTVTLAIGEPYGYRGETDLASAANRSNGDGRIYNHRYNGLFGILNNSEVCRATDVNKSIIEGTVSVYPTANSVYVGSVAAIVKGTTKFYSLNVTTTFDYGGNKSIYFGRLIGEVNQPKSLSEVTLRIQGINISGNVTGSNSDKDTCIGGVIGKIYHNTNEIENWRFQKIEIGGKIENSAEKTSQSIGGLIAIITGYSATSDFKARTLTLTDITTKNLEIRAGKSTSMGGLLGYQWLNTNVDFGVKKSNSDAYTAVSIDSNSKVTALGAVKDMAGLVYNATGKWTVNNLDVKSINVEAVSPRSFGLIINKGWYCDSGKNYKTDGSSSAIYLLLPREDSYDITYSGTTLTSLNGAVVYDELVAYSAYYRDDGNTRYNVDESGDEYILKNGAGIVSIKTSENSGLNMNGSTLSKSYQAQTAQGAKPNPWTRYYYNLDTVTNSSSSISEHKLMRWALNQYAHQSIKSSFVNPFTNNEITSATYDMKGYSWYPVDVDNNVKIQGTFKFYNYEFEHSEAVNGGTYSSQKTSLNNSTYSSTTQHYLLHSSLLRNVYSGKTVTVNSVTLQGNIPVINGYVGSLICGSVTGSSETNKSIINIDGLNLDGVYIHNMANVTGNSKTYAPLIINKIFKYTNLTIKNVKTTNKYTTNTSVNVPHILDDGTYPKAASSLIGEVGTSTAKGLNLNFTMIQLDGRMASVDNTNGKNDALDTAYGTERTIFTKATLLDKFEYDSGSTGIYTYTWDNDWGSGGRYVTYGKEVGYITEGEYPNLERQYIEGSTDSASEYTSPISNGDADGNYMNTNKDNFLPYVATAYASNGTTHQLEVNHRTTTAEGCGTYNDPYMIQNGSDLETFAKILNGNYEGTSLILPSGNERNAYWCDDKAGKTKHNVFTYGGSTYDCEGQTSLSTTQVRTYLAGAYYKLGKNIELSATYPGLSNFDSITNSNKFAVFRGVIEGDGYSITNKSTSPLIGCSYGSVIRQLTISVKSTNNISITQENNTDTFPTCKSYGGVISNVLAGDNILDEVSVTFSSMESYIDLVGEKAQLIPVGGYIGVIVDGAVILKNMNSSAQGLSTASAGTLNKTEITSVYDEDEEEYISTAQRVGLSISDKQWLYVNPIIGRVLNGYAVTESTSYVTSEEDVTMHNGTKNYSIADINKNETNKLSTSDYTVVSGASSMYSTDVSIPNAQALFVLSLLTQSSTTVGTPSSLSIGASNSYGGTYHRMRCADYSAIGTNASNDNKPADYTRAVTDHGTSGIPFLVKNFTNVIEGTNKYGVLALTHNNTVCNFSFGGTDTEWVLPDGFRGIGSIGFKRTDLTNRTISLHKFNGKNNDGAGDEITINLNMDLQHYENGFDNYLPVNNGSDCIGGFGLFDTLHQNRKSQGAIANDYKISDLNISGRINYFVFKHSSNDGTDKYISTYVHNNAYLNTGGIAGNAGMLDSDSFKVEKIGLSGLTVNGFETAGGFFGNLQLKNENNTNHKVSISNISAETEFTVTSKRYSGGIIGYFKQGNLEIEDVTIKLPNVITEYRGNAYQDFLNGAGGVIGFAQSESNNAPIVLKGVTLGEKNKDIISRIGYKDGDTFFRSADGDNSKGDDTVVAGGIIGRSYTNGSVTENGIKYSLKLEDCNVYNISLYGHRVGGLIGADIGDGSSKYTSYLAFLNCKVECDNNSAMIKGYTDRVTISKLQHRACGGIIGGAKAAQIIVDTCTVKGYTLWGYNDTAGICGNLEVPLYVHNFKISNVVFKSDYAASLVGWLNKSLQGYNILCDDVQFQDKSGRNHYISASHGYLVAKNNVKSIKIAGLSIHNAMPRSDQYFIPPRLSGTNDYNNGGYVIFADYNGAASEANNVFSDVNNALNVKNYNNQEVAASNPDADNYPYVTSSPKMFIGTDQFLTGDAVSATNYDDSALKQIILDKQDSQKSLNGAQSYQTAPDVNTNWLADITEHLTTSREEYGNQSMPNFPLLVVEDTNRDKVTNYINYSLQNLTNTSYTFQGDLSKVYSVTLHKCIYNSSTGKFTIGTGSGDGKPEGEEDNRCSLRRYNTGFQMDDTKIDNADPNTPQFTLMDVKFFDPSSNGGKVAYHLYVPIYVKKMIQYKFEAKIESGTNYYPGAYTSTSKTLFENLGNPVTMKIDYTYDREATDWADAINGGENVYANSNFYKVLKMTMNENGWAPNSRLVLVDASNNDKHYYMDAAISQKDADGTYHIPFKNFTSDGTAQGAYSPAPMNKLLDVTCTETQNGPLIRTNNDSEATVQDVDGNYYKPRPDGNTSQGYTATVSENIKAETYYLTFFTNKSSGTNNVYHYQIYSLERFEKSGVTEADKNWKPNKIIRSYNDPVHLFIGNLYEYIGEQGQQFTIDVTPRVPSTYEMSKNNNILTITMTAHLGLTQAAKDAYVVNNLTNNPNSTIFQTFLMNYDMREVGETISKIGVETSAIAGISILDYKVYHGATTSGTGDDVSYSDPDQLKSNNYIELRNNQNLNEYLRDNNNDNAATIQVTFAIEYLEKSLSKQFPERTEVNASDIGALVKGYSNLSSQAANGVNSASSLAAADTHRYYTTNIQTAKLTYGVEKTLSSADGYYSSLGINPFDAQTETTNKGHIDSTAIYSFVDISDPDDYIEFNMSLRDKTDGYDRTPLELAEYLENITIKSGNTTLYTQGTAVSNENIVADISQDGTMLTLRAHKDQINKIAEKIYTIDISYDVLTGEKNGFGTTKAYSNYMVLLTADLYSSMSDTTSSTNPTRASDHIIYTNSKLKYKLIDE